mmetsp:Transcript_10628/g.19246  ORF Transcript_10628/g.19246 Transcript_10628/m.19246 type:complete len:307 (-) Transcript_10628:4280-5200(-)
MPSATSRSSLSLWIRPRRVSRTPPTVASLPSATAMDPRRAPSPSSPLARKTPPSLSSREVEMKASARPPSPRSNSALLTLLPPQTLAPSTSTVLRPTLRPWRFPSLPSLRLVPLPPRSTTWTSRPPVWKSLPTSRTTWFTSRSPPSPRTPSSASAPPSSTLRRSQDPSSRHFLPLFTPVSKESTETTEVAATHPSPSPRAWRPSSQRLIPTELFLCSPSRLRTSAPLGVPRSPDTAQAAGDYPPLPSLTKTQSCSPPEGAMAVSSSGPLDRTRGTTLPLRPRSRLPTSPPQRRRKSRRRRRRDSSR